MLLYKSKSLDLVEMPAKSQIGYPSKASISVACIEIKQIEEHFPSEEVIKYPVPVIFPVSRTCTMQPTKERKNIEYSFI